MTTIGIIGAGRIRSVLKFLVRGLALVAHGVVEFVVGNTNQLAFKHSQMTG